ncbi:MAG TPA: dienelactone hydrolase family protein [Candidatus Limnocylindrales bacterium]|nr:dienelactone hydrolase family protein [Candidatus Limnocylindrales bacterium]
MNTKSERVQIPVGAASMPAYLSRPSDDGNRSRLPGVLVYQEIFGVNHHIKSVADRVAAEGYVALAPELFYRTAPGIELGYDADGLARGIGLMQQVRPQEIQADVSAAYDWLRGRSDVGGKGIGAIGFCFGGHMAYRTACELPIAAAASFYGGGIAGGMGPGPATVELTPKIKGRIACFFGENDGYIPASDVEKIRSALEAAGVRHEVVVYPGVGHGFFCDERPDYDEKSATDAWRRVVSLFKDELKE